MYDHTLHRGRKHFCPYCLQAFSTEEISKRHIKDYFKNNRKELLCLKKVNMLNKKNTTLSNVGSITLLY